ncbi:MAG: nuclear transport factor 2 family protein [Acidimicrobiia bacterium]|nr:nuclear transport factor 2 family protein [Acidimicrobiia bacterium]
MRELDDAGTRSVVAVHRLQSAYGDSVTRRAWDEVVALFDADASVHIDTRTRPAFTLTGPKAIATFIEQSLEGFAFFEFAILNAVVELTGEATATGRVYICELRHDHAGEWTQAYGLYRDRYRRSDGHWRIADRRYTSLARTGARVESFAFPDPPR